MQTVGERRACGSTRLNAQCSPHSRITGVRRALPPGSEYLKASAQEYDGAEPAASSIAAANLFRLGALSSTEDGARWPVC